MLLQDDRREGDRHRHLDRDEQRGRRRPDEPHALEERRHREHRADERRTDEAGEPGRAADGAERAEHAARDDERRRRTRSQVGGERDRVGVAQQPIGEQDVDGVRGGGAERHRDPDRVRVRRGAADERDASEDPHEREETTPREALAADHRGHADDEHEVGVVHERRERCRRALERAEEERRVERVDDGTEHEGAERGPDRNAEHPAAGDPDEQAVPPRGTARRARR